MSGLRVIAYVSAAVHPLGEGALNELLRVSRGRNAINGVTGLLLHSDGNFLQYIEGEDWLLAPIWESIQRDSRHHRINTLLNGPTGSREFAAWSMASGTADLPAFLALSGTGWNLDPEAAHSKFSQELSPGRQLIRAVWAGMRSGT